MILSTIGKELENVGNLQKTLELAKTGKPTSATSKDLIQNISLAPSLAKAASETLAKYRGSPDHAKLLKDAPSLTLTQLRDRLKAILTSDSFKSLTSQLSSQQGASEGPFDVIPKAVSLGLQAEGDIVVGLSGGVGYVIDLAKSDAQSALYLNGALSEGADAGGEGGVCLGIWTNPVAEIQGYYSGAELDITDTAGVMVAGFLKGVQPALVLFGVNIGADDGVEAKEFYNLTINVDGATAKLIETEQTLVGALKSLPSEISSKIHI